MEITIELGMDTCRTLCVVFLWQIQVSAQITTFLTGREIRTDILPLGELLSDKKPKQQPFTVYKCSLMSCVMECLARVHCKSFSYQRDNISCELYGVHNSSFLVEKNGWVYSDKKSWPKVTYF